MNKCKECGKEFKKTVPQQIYCSKKCRVKYCQKRHYNNNKDKIKIYREKNKETNKAYQKIYREKNKKKNKTYQKQYRKENKKKIKEQQKMYYKNNKSLYRIKSKICREKNKEKIKKAKSIYYYKNKSSIIEKGRIYSNTRRKKDINYKLRHYLSTRIWYALKKKKKCIKTMKLVGCSLNELKIYLENKFSNGMSWKNYGEWHVDHKKPCAHFNLVDLNQQKICFHYTNLQPMWAKDNWEKGCRI